MRSPFLHHTQGAPLALVCRAPARAHAGLSVCLMGGLRQLDECGPRIV